MPDKREALKNADSFNWYATQNLWTVLCCRLFGLSTEADSVDPLCDDDICE